MELSDICFTSNYIELLITLFDQSKPKRSYHDVDNYF